MQMKKGGGSSEITWFHPKPVTWTENSWTKREVDTDEELAVSGR